MQSEIHPQPLKVTEQNPVWIERQLAHVPGVSLVKVNHQLKDIKEKSWVKWCTFSQNPAKLSYAYLFTPSQALSKGCVSPLTFYYAKRPTGYHQLQIEIRALRKDLSARNPAVTAVPIINERELTQREI
jgi:hypothetical protein